MKLRFADPLCGTSLALRSVMERRALIERLILGLISFSGITAILSACGNAGSDEPLNRGPNAGNNENSCTGGARGTIAANHGHILTISSADIAEGRPRSFSIRGNSAHNHSVTLTTQDLATLRSGQSITVTSGTNNSHNHSITLRCA